MSKSSTVGVAIAVGGAALAAVGIGLLVRERRRDGLAGLGSHQLGAQPKQVKPGAYKKAPVVGRKRTGDMTVTMYADSSMPIEMRVGIIQDMVDETLRKGEVRQLAHAIVGSGNKTVRVGKYDVSVRGAGCSPNDASCKADAIGRWVAANVRYSGDIAPVKKGRNGPVEAIDYFQSARRTIEAGGGDCDDQAGVNCPLLEEVGVPCSHRITAARPQSDWGHIYTMGNANGSMMALDTTLPGYRTGRQARHARFVDFPATRRSGR